MCYNFPNCKIRKKLMKINRTTTSLIPLNIKLSNSLVNNSSLSRRSFVSGLGLGATAFCLSPITAILADDSSASLEKQFDGKFDEAVNTYKLVKEGPPLTSKLKEILDLSKSDFSVFLNWYENKVNDKSILSSSDYQESLALLAKSLVESCESSICQDYIRKKMNDEEELLPNVPKKAFNQDNVNVRQSMLLSSFLKSNRKLVENNLKSLKIVSIGLENCDKIIFPKLGNYRRSDFNEMVSVGRNDQLVVNNLGVELVNLYDASLRGVKSIIQSDSVQDKKEIDRLETLAFEIPWDVEVFDDRPDIQNKIASSLAENLFNLKEKQGDVETLSRMINKIGTGTMGWSPYVVYSLIDKSPQFFKSIGDRCVEGIKNSETFEGEESSFSYASRFLDFFYEKSLSIKGQSYRFTSAGGVPSRFQTKQSPEVGHTPSVGAERKKRIEDWCQESIVKPITTAMIVRFNAEKVVAEDKPSREGGYLERYVDDVSWKNLNTNLLKHIRIAELAKGLNVAIEKRLSEDKDPYNREMLYRVLPYSGKVEFSRLTGILENENGIPPIRGLAYSLLVNLESDSGGIKKSDFVEKLEKIINNEIEVRGLPDIDQKLSKEDFDKELENRRERRIYRGLTALYEDENLSPAQKLIVASLQVSCVTDGRLLMSLMPHRKFSGPTVIKTFRRRGSETVVKQQYGDKQAEEKISGLKNDGWVEDRNKEKLEYSDESRRDGKALGNFIHNSFLLISYLGAQCTTDSTDPNSAYFTESEKLKNTLAKFVETKSRNCLIEPLLYSGVEKLGERIGALMELYENMVDNSTEHEIFIAKKQEALNGFLFKHNKTAKEVFSVYESVVERIRQGQDEDLVRELAKKKDIDIFTMSIHSHEYKNKVATIKDSDDYKKQMREMNKHIEEIKALIVQGYLNTSRHKKMQRNRITLYKLSEKSLDEAMLNNPQKYMKDFYGVDITNN